MEALPSLPPELLAFAAPVARDAAPLLGSGAAESEQEGAALPFELYLALMTTPLGTGEAWPASGKELPLAPTFAAAAPQAASVAAMPAQESALLGFIGADVGAQVADAEPLPGLNTDDWPQPLPLQPTSAPVLSVEEAVVPTQIDATDAMPTAAADAVAPEVAELANSTPEDGVDVTELLERTAPDARASRPQSLTAERPLVPPAQARSVLETTRGIYAETADRDSPPVIEVTKLSRAVAPAVAEAAGATNEWLPAAQTANTSSAHAAAQSAAAASPSVDLRTPNWQEAFADRVQWLAGHHGGEARITLNPPELGAVDLKVSLVDDKTYVQLTAATAAARDELAQHLPRLRELFVASGIELGGASVHDGRAGNGAGAGGSERSPLPEPRLPASFADLADEPAMPAVPRRSLGRIDLFA